MGILVQSLRTAKPPGAPEYLTKRLAMGLRFPNLPSARPGPRGVHQLMGGSDPAAVSAGLFPAADGAERAGQRGRGGGT
jgi:hypothetical protein